MPPAYPYPSGQLCIPYIPIPIRTKFRRTKFFTDNTFRRTKFSASTPDFRHFCPPKFCPIKYLEYLLMFAFVDCKISVCCVLLCSFVSFCHFPHTDVTCLTQRRFATTSPWNYNKILSLDSLSCEKRV